MSSPRSGRKGSRVPSKSEALSVDIHVLACGHGDTILLHLPGHKWVLVDCHLPAGPIREHFFRFVDERDISRLDLVCLTHPHQDHFAGMLAVVDHFTSDGRSLGTYCDSGVDPKQVIDILHAENRPPSEVFEYQRLHRRLDDLIRRNVIRYFRIDENTSPVIGVAECDDGVRLLPLGPDPAVVRRMTRDALRTGAVQGSANRISLVLGLEVHDAELQFHAFLAGDAEPQSISRALGRWADALSHRGPTPRLDAVKIPHHGSVRSHLARLFTAKRPNVEAVAAVPAGTRRVLPDKRVLRDYLQAGWKVLLTTKRTASRTQATPLTLSGAHANVSPTSEEWDIQVGWSPGQGLTWGPPEALVDEDDLPLYEAAPLATTGSPSA